MAEVGLDAMDEEALPTLTSYEQRHQVGELGSSSEDESASSSEEERHDEKEEETEEHMGDAGFPLPFALAPGCSCMLRTKRTKPTCDCAHGGRPSMLPCQAGAQVFSSGSTPCSRELAAQIEAAALSTSRVHGRSTTNTPWIYARRLNIRHQRRLFMSWCREWIETLYGADSSRVRAARHEPHIVKYDHSLHQGFKGIGTHQDDSFVTCIMGLSPPTSYSGGGTYFPHLEETVRLGPGEVLLFQGQQGVFSAPHRAQPISGGKRVLLIAFFKLRTKRKTKRRKRPKAKRSITPRRAS
jgi:hypothetical protein